MNLSTAVLLAEYDLQTSNGGNVTNPSQLKPSYTGPGSNFLFMFVQWMQGWSIYLLAAIGIAAIVLIFGGKIGMSGRSQAIGLWTLFGIACAWALIGGIGGGASFFTGMGQHIVW